LLVVSSAFASAFPARDQLTSLKRSVFYEVKVWGVKQLVDKT